MVVTCPVGMSIPVVPVSKHNPVLSTKRPKYLRKRALRFARRTAEGGCPHMFMVPGWLTEEIE